MAVIQGVTVNWRLSPRVITIPITESEITIDDLQDTLLDLEDDDEGMVWPHLRETSGGEALGAGVTVGITTELQNAQLAFAARTTSSSEGTATTGNAAGIKLIDSAASFETDGVSNGDVIVNFTDKSVASVITVDSQIQITHEPLADGTGNDWDVNDEYKIWPWTVCEVTGGNCVAVDDVAAEIDPVLPRFGVSYLRTSSSSATLQELSAIQFSSFNGGVTVDIANGVSGTVFPVGTPQDPVNNMADALTIAAARGFTAFFINGNVTLDSGLNYEQYSFYGESMDKTTITVSSSAQTEKCEFYECTITGTLDGLCKVKNAAIANLDYVSGVIELCILQGEIVLGGGANAYFLDCWAGTLLGVPPSIDMGGSGQTLVMQNFNGYIQWKNKSGSDQANASLNAGWVMLDSTITAGAVTIIGVGHVEDNSTGTTTVNTDHLIEATEIHELHKLQGLHPDHPMTVTPTSRTVDTIEQTISGDGETSTTVTRTS
jgi:hypothetical protein